MNNQEAYEQRKEALLNDKTLNADNRKLWKEFFIFEELNLKRRNGLPKLDEKSYKTLKDYPRKFRNVNAWFNNKAWNIKAKNHITQEDINKVYNNLEDEKLINLKGKPYKDKDSYYYKVFLSKPFELAGQTAAVRKVMIFKTNNKQNEVRFFREDGFRKTVNLIPQPKHKLLIWLAFDVGENVSSLVQLKKRDVRKNYDNETKSHEYLINLRKETLKRARTPRVEPTLFKETVELLDIVLEGKQEDDFIFDFKEKQAEKSFKRACNLSGLKCEPDGDFPRLKDLRSSMACNLLSKGWSCEEVNSRLGHRLNSDALGRYVSHLALNKQKPKVKMQQGKIAELENKIEEFESQAKLNKQRMERSLNEANEKIDLVLKEIEILKLKKDVYAKALEIVDYKKFKKLNEKIEDR